MGYARLVGAAAAAALCVWTLAGPAQTEEPTPTTVVVAQADVAASAPREPVDPLPATLTPAQARGLLIALMLQVPGAFEAALEEVTESYSPNASR